MSEKGEPNHSNATEDISSDKIVDEVIESCKNLNCDNEEKGAEEKSYGEDAEKNDSETFEDCVEHLDDDFIDEVYLKDLEVNYSEEELQEKKTSAIKCKEKGNFLFKEEKYEEARKTYTDALRTCPLAFKEERSFLFGNRAACKMKLELKKEAIEDCTKAIELNPTYVRALLRRAKLYESDEKLDEALEDYKKILELDPGNSEAKGACMRLPSEIHERNEKLKEQMLGSLKELGNKILKPFGLSTENFQVQQDPNSGGYSINFKK